MQDDIEHTNDRDKTAVSLRAAACLTTALIAAGVLLTGCGGNSPTGGVASLGTHASKTSTTSSTASGPSEGRESSPGSQAVAYSACVRAHGVPNFPDPKITTHGNGVSMAIGINPSISGNPHFKSAQQACSKLLPGGGPGGGSNHQITPQEQTQYLKAAACIRSHGIPNFPDPTFSGGGVHIAHQGLNESSPAFKAAVQACESLIPGGVHGDRSASARPAPQPAP
jgi:hypothetical protein